MKFLVKFSLLVLLTQGCGSLQPAFSQFTTSQINGTKVQEPFYPLNETKLYGAVPGQSIQVDANGNLVGSNATSLLADVVAGSDCGAKIGATLTKLNGPGIVKISVACGTITTAITLGNNQILEFMPGTYQVGATITVTGNNAAIIGFPVSNVGNGPVLLQEKAGSNLTHLLNVTGGFFTLKDVSFDGQQFDSLYGLTLVGGTGYTSAPTVAVTGCSTSPHPIVAASGGAVVHAALSDFSDGYFSGAGCTGTLTCTLTGGGGTGASCTAYAGPALNPTGGSTIFSSGLRTTFEHVTSQQSPTHGFELGMGSSGTVWIYSTSLFNQSDGVLLRDVTDASFQTLTAMENNRGWGVEVSNSAGNRFQNGDFGGNIMGGVHICGVAAGHTTATGNCGSSSTSHPFGASNIVTNNQFGTNNGPDIEVDGYDTVNGAYVSQQNSFTGNMIFSSGIRTDNTYPAISIVNSAWNLVQGNNIADASPHTYSTGISVTGNYDLGETVVANLLEVVHTGLTIPGNTLALGNGPNVSQSLSNTVLTGNTNLFGPMYVQNQNLATGSTNYPSNSLFWFASFYGTDGNSHICSLGSSLQIAAGTTPNSVLTFTPTGCLGINSVSFPRYNSPLFTPASSSAACSPGDFADDTSYHYVCTAASTWKRVALATF